jgi:hypothetical protein
MLVPQQALNSRVGDAVSAHVVPRNGGASVSAQEMDALSAF